MKKLVLRFAVITLAASAFGAVQRTASGIGVGNAPDQATADQQADAGWLSASPARSNCAFRGDTNHLNADGPTDFAAIPRSCDCKGFCCSVELRSPRGETPPRLPGLSKRTALTAIGG
jgi:hypothetical protein